MSSDIPTHPQAASTPAPPDADDLALYCIHCGYCLAGLTEDRCPECGESFDREALTDWIITQRLPLTCRPQDGTISPLGSLIVRSLIEPSRLGRELPPLGRSEDALVYGLGTRFAAIVALPLTTLMCLTASGWLRDLEGRTLVTLTLIGFTAAVSSWVCEQAIARILAAGVRPWGVPDSPAHRVVFWRNLCACFSTWLPLSMVAMSLGGFVLAVISHFIPVHLAVILMLGGSLGGWWYALARAIWARTSPSWARTAAIGLIPVMGVLAIVLGSALVVAGMAILIFR